MTYNIIVFALLAAVGVANSQLCSAQESDEAKSGNNQQAQPFKIGSDTTFVLGPVSDDGTIDYAAAINQRMRAEIKPEENAAVWIIRALGPNVPEYKYEPNLFQELGMQRPPVHGDYLQPEYPKPDVDVRNLDKQQQAELVETQIGQYIDSMERPWKPSEFPEIAEWIESNTSPLDVIHSATLCKRFFKPILLEEEPGENGIFTPPLIADILPLNPLNHSIARMLCSRAMLHLGNGDHKRAWQDLIACRRLARLISQGPCLIDVLVGYAIEQTVNDATVAFMIHAKASPAEWKSYLSEMKSLPPLAKTSEKVNLMERCSTLDAIQTMAIGENEAVALLEIEPDLGKLGRIVETFGLQSIDWTGALRVANQWYNRLVIAMKLPSYSERASAFAKIETELETMTLTITDPTKLVKIQEELQQEKQGKKTVDGGVVSRTLGEIVVTLMLPAVSSASLSEDRIRQQTAQINIALGLAGYHAAKGTYPEHLSDLKPAYLKQIPPDIFTGTPLLYQRTDEGYLLYSVGPNRKDDAGRTHLSANPGDDLTVRVGLP
jgi:hypothetical protein